MMKKIIEIRCEELIRKRLDGWKDTLEILELNLLLLGSMEKDHKLIWYYKQNLL